MYFLRPRWVFGVYMLMVMVFISPSITQRGNIGMSMLYVTLFFESICFPTIVALGMKGLGRHTKRGSGFIVAGVLGGAWYVSFYPAAFFMVLIFTDTNSVLVFRP